MENYLNSAANEDIKVIDREKAMYIFKSFCLSVGHKNSFFVGDIVQLVVDILSDPTGDVDNFVVTAIIIQADMSIKYGIRYKDEYLEVYGFEIIHANKGK